MEINGKCVDKIVQVQLPILPCTIAIANVRKFLHMPCCYEVQSFLAGLSARPDARLRPWGSVPGTMTHPLRQSVYMILKSVCRGFFGKQLPLYSDYFE